MLNSISYHWYRFKYHHGKSLPLRKPVDVSIELASECNMKCGYCYHGDQARLPFAKGIMPMKTAIEIVNQAARLGANSLKLNWKGESTINPHFELITDVAKKWARGSTFIERLTNSNFKFRTDREDIFRGLANQTKVKISYDSFRADVFEAQRSGGDHGLTTANITKFYNHPSRIRSGTQMVIQAVRTQANKNEDLEGLTRYMWPDAELSIRDMVMGRTAKDVSALSVRGRDKENRQSCEQAHVRLLFNWKGEAFPCCPDIGEKLKFGSIHETSMRDLFNSALAKQLRKELKSGEAFLEDPCRTCSSFESYKGFTPKYGS